MKAHICIGGPLDGQHATSIDFYGQWIKKSDGSLSHREEGMYEHLDREYEQFNNASRGNEKKRACVAWIHTSLLIPSISPKKR